MSSHCRTMLETWPSSFYFLRFVFSFYLEILLSNNRNVSDCQGKLNVEQNGLEETRECHLAQYSVFAQITWIIPDGIPNPARKDSTSPVKNPGTMSKCSNTIPNPTPNQTKISNRKKLWTRVRLFKRFHLEVPY